MQKRVDLHMETNTARIVLSGAGNAGFDRDLRIALSEVLDQVGAAPGVRRIVLVGDDRGWPCATDVMGDYMAEDGVPTLGALADRLAGIAIPVVAVLGGMISGGAIALSQAARLRIALAGTRFLALEFGLGLIPAGGGFVRLCRRGGARAAIDFVENRRILEADAAARIGLCDMVVGDLQTAIRLIETGPPSAGPLAIDDARAYLEGVSVLRARPPIGPMDPVARRLAEIAEAALLLPEEEAIGFETVAFDDLAQADLSRGLRHLARARARAGHLAGLSATEAVGPGAIIGLWNQPDRLVLGLLAAGAQVRLGNSDPTRLEAGVRAVAEALHKALETGDITPEVRDARWARLDLVADPSGFADVPQIIASPRPGEAARIRSHAEGTQIALDGVPINEGEYGFTRLPGLVELHPGSSAPNDPDMQRFAAALRRGGDLVLHSNGLAQWLEVAFILAAERAVLAGAEPASVDAALTGWGFAEGPFARLDRRGLSVVFGAITRTPWSAGPYLNWLGLDGRTGRAAGKGVWLYRDRDRLPWPGEAEELALLRQEAGIEARPVPAREIVSRVLAELAQAGVIALQGGRVHRAGDVDLVSIAGLGFPRHRGGPLFEADRIGLIATRKRLRLLADEGGPAPATLWDVLIRNGRTLADLDAD